MVGIALVLLVAFAGCGARPIAAPASANLSDWTTLRAEHRATVEAAGESRRLRGLVAVARPDRLRLRAFGPGGLTLFDLIYRHGETTVLSALLGRADEKLQPILRGLGSDLAGLYNLQPQPAGRTVVPQNGHLLLRDSERTIELSEFRTIAGRAIPTRIQIDHPALAYRVTIEVVDVTLDSLLDPALFTPP